MTETILSKTAKNLESVRKILTSLIWIAIVVVVLAALGRFFLASGGAPKSDEPKKVKAVQPVVDWAAVDSSIASAMSDSRLSTEDYVTKRMNVWRAGLMEKVDNDFLEWYFGYWTQQVIGLKSLWQAGLHRWIEGQPSAAEKLTEEIQEEFAKRVLRPQIAELALENIARDTANHYAVELRKNIAQVPEKYKIPTAQWDQYLEGIAITATDVEGNRETPVTLKAMTASGAGGAVLLAGKMKLLVGKVSAKMLAKSAGKAASKMAAKTGAKVAAKAGGKFLGPIVGVGVLAWDAWDHNATKAENWPILRESLSDYLLEMQSILISDPETGMMATINDLESQVLDGIQSSSSGG